MTALPDGAPAGRIRLAYQDYASLPQDGRRYEILDRELSVTRAPSPRHRTVSRNLEWVLHGYVREKGLGQVFCAPVEAILAEAAVVQPDLLFVRAEREAIVSERGIEGAADLGVEILSRATARQDRGAKKVRYARFGVGHYWIVDPEARAIEPYELGEGGGYRLAARAEAPGRLEPRLFPGLSIDLGEIFA